MNGAITDNTRTENENIETTAADVGQTEETITASPAKTDREPISEINTDARDYKAADSAAGLPKTNIYPMTVRDTVSFVIAIAVCAVAIPLTLWGGFRSGFTVSYAALFALFTAFLAQKGTMPGPFQWICGILSLLGSGVYAYSSNESVNFFLFLFVFINATLWFSSLCGVRDNKTDAGFLHASVGRPFAFSFGRMPKLFRSVFSPKQGGSKNTGKALIGFLCAIPLLLTVVFLLKSADIAFAALINKIFNTATVWKAIVGLTIAPFIVSFVFALKKGEKCEKTESSFVGMKDNTYIVSFLAVLCAVYLLYLFSQFAYFTDALSGILPEKVLPSAYARRGFFEMCIIAGINLSLVYLAEFLMNRKLKSFVAVKGECTFICVFTLFIISTAIAKMVLYIGRFGMTPLRIFTSVFMVFIAVTFIAIVAKLFVEKIPVFRIAAVCASVLLIAMGAANINGFIADYNVNAYLDGSLSTVDIDTLADMDLAAVPSLIKLQKECAKRPGESKMVYDIKIKLGEIRSRYYTRNGIYYTFENNEPGSWNYSDYKGMKALEEYYKMNVKR